MILWLECGRNLGYVNDRQKSGIDDENLCHLSSLDALAAEFIPLNGKSQLADLVS
jgi:hypothetical protein